MLCGDKAVIDKMRHLIKVHGGTMYQFWINAAMALYHLEGLDERLKAVVKRSTELFTQLNKLPRFQASACARFIFTTRPACSSLRAIGPTDTGSTKNLNSSLCNKSFSIANLGSH